MPGWIEVALRSFVGILIIMFATRLFVRKSLAQATYFEALAIFVIGIIVAIGSVMLNINIGFLLTALFVWILIPYLVGILSLKSKTFRNLVGGQGIPIIKDGKVLEDNMKKQRYTSDDLLKQLRTRNVFNVADVEFAVLEPTGELNVLLKKQKQPLTPMDLQVPVAPIKEPQTVIMDGKILDEPLATMGFNRRWLEGEVDKQGAAIENVYLGQIDSYGQLTLDLFDDKLKVPAPVEKPMLLSTIKKCQADLEGFALATDSQKIKKMYEHSAKEMQDVMQKLSPYLRD
ncbi:DUF421 domain-containing protein [Desertibacillus haloalkaliphilus]|uniref:DUF421 domain-containing protein n=1 Tax=Desertibacillus haloalkaliphilus TaxID=1328930 RepID=UPI001C268539|nr:DUF421 domain-containing protein [Desertibacillus haloalkaliphilus]MBU8907169.1 DUF421 domain-containing protein [Desertibacillus haloalkaliphilus]